MEAATGVQASQLGKRPAYRLPFDAGRLLQAPLSCTLLGEEIRLGASLFNPHRLLGLPSTARTAEFASARQRFRNLHRLNPGSVLEPQIQTGYDVLCERHRIDSASLLARLDNPRHRTLDELWWLHGSQEDMALLRQERRMDSPVVLDRWQVCKDSSTGLERSLHTHSLAVLLYNKAIALELQLDPNSGQHWDRVHNVWAEVIADSTYWGYVRSRIAEADDPRITVDDVRVLREQLPGVLLSAHIALARAFEAGESPDGFQRHFACIARSPFANRRSSLVSLVKSLIRDRLTSVIDKINSGLLAVDGTLPRERFRVLCEPLFDEAEALLGKLSNQLLIPEDLIRETEFDSVTEQLSEAINTKLSYDGGDRPRALLYSIQLTKRALRLPATEAHRVRMEQSIRSDCKYLYGDFTDDPPDASMCWFTAREPADADSSLVLPLYKVTNREVIVDRSNGEAGLNAEFTKECLLVPRSIRAAEAHRARKTELLITVPREKMDASQLAALVEIERLSADADASSARRLEDGRRKEDQEDARCKAEILNYDAEAEPRVREARASIARLESERRKKTATEQAALAEVLRHLRDERSNSLRRAEVAAGVVKDRNSGLSGAYKLELPWFAAPALLLLSPIDEGLRIILWLVLSIAVLVVCRRIRSARIHRAAESVRVLKSEFEKREAEAKRRSNAVEKEIKTKHEPSAYNAVIQVVEAGRSSLNKRSANTIADIRQRTTKDIADIAAALSAQIAEARKKITVTIKIKPESAKNEFPAMMAARKKGFKHGSEPPDSELSMTSEERMIAMQKLNSLG